MARFLLLASSPRALSHIPEQRLLPHSHLRKVMFSTMVYPPKPPIPPDPPPTLQTMYPTPQSKALITRSPPLRPDLNNKSSSSSTSYIDLQEPCSSISSTSIFSGSSLNCDFSHPASSCRVGPTRVNEFLAVDFALTPAIDLASTPAVDNTPAVDLASTPEQAPSQHGQHQVPHRLENRATHDIFCFVDVAWLSSSSLYGKGWITQDSHQTVLAQGSSSQRWVASALTQAFFLKDNVEISLDSFFSQIKQRVALPPCGITTPLPPWFVWHLWKAHNLLLFENRQLSKEDVARNIMRDAKEWQEAQTPNPEPPLFSPVPKQSHVSTSITSCFVDAAWHSSYLLGGMGWCFVDPHSNPIAQGSLTHLFVSSALMAEAIALKAALQVAISLEILHLTVFSDSLSLVSLLNSNSVVNELISILIDTRVVLESFSSISILYVSRLANVKADAIAKAALAPLLL